MSAYMCSDDHLIQLAAFLVDAYTRAPHPRGLEALCRPIVADIRPNECTGKEAVTLGIARLLAAENARSLVYLYGDKAREALPSYTVQDATRALFQMSLVQPVMILSPLSCYEYQACESKDWEATTAYRICDLIRRVVCRRLPGYDSGNWGAPFESEIRRAG